MDIQFKIPYAHYLNKKYSGGPVVEWISDDDNGNYVDAVYSDRIGVGVVKTVNLARDAAKAIFEIGSAAYYQKYLQVFFEDESIKLKKIAQGVNKSNGYSYLIFFYS